MRFSLNFLIIIVTVFLVSVGFAQEGTSARSGQAYAGSDMPSDRVSIRA